MKFLLVTACLVFISNLAQGRQGFGPTEQEWGFVTVREGAHLFWWLHQTSANVDSYTERPLVIWLQGGPGASSTGYGNFAELGPLDVDLQPRNTTWINDVNVLFVDNPVGSGFSYADTSDALVTNNRQIAEDFLVLLQGFYQAVPDLLETPLYIFCESYGGKMTAEIALVLDQAIKNGDLNINFRGIGLGDSWISPIDSVLTWGPYLLSAGLVDQDGYNSIQKVAELTRQAIDDGDFESATSLWGQAEWAVLVATEGVDFYNILKKIPASRKNMQLKLHKPQVRDEDDDKIEVIMNGAVRDSLGIDVAWGRQSGAVFDALDGDFMRPVTDIVETLLNTTDIKVAVYNGQLDLIVDTPGTIDWVDRLQFNGVEQYKISPRESIVANSFIEGFEKKGGNLFVYWVSRAGHMVPLDNPAAMRYILSEITDGFSVKNRK